MNFYHILFALKQGFNRNLTWYENLFVKFYNNTIAKLTAKILRIKGNTVSFNQLAQNGNFVDTSGWFCANQTLSAENNVLTITINRTVINFYQSISVLTASHKYFIRFSVKASETMSDLRCRLYSSQGSSTSSNRTINTSWGTQTFILETPSSFGGTSKQMYIYPNYGDTVSSGTVNLKNVVVIDLTLMGIDNLTTTAEVEAWLSSHIGALPYYDYTQGTLIPFMGTGIKTENADQTESNTLSLPTSAYFPTGMKSAGSVYDELSDKAYTRVGSVDLGSLDWTYFSSWGAGDVFQSRSAVVQPTATRVVANVVTAKYKTVSRDDSYDNYTTGVCSVTVGGAIQIRDSAYIDTTAFKNSLSGQYLYFALETPTETEISPELDLSYPIEWGGTEQILPVNTSTPTTSGIVADIKYPDGIRYDQTFVYRVIEKATQLGNRALSIMLGKKVETDNPEEPLDILLKGEK